MKLIQISDFKKDHSMGYVNVDEFQNINDELSRRILKLNFSSAEEEFNEDKNFIYCPFSLACSWLYGRGSCRLCNG